MKPTRADFDRAVAQPWSSITCLVAQLMIRRGVTPQSQQGIVPPPYKLQLDSSAVARRNGIRHEMYEFDCNFNEPGDEKKPELQKLRASLPRFNWPWETLK